MPSWCASCSRVRLFGEGFRLKDFSRMASCCGVVRVRLRGGSLSKAGSSNIPDAEAVAADVVGGGGGGGRAPAPAMGKNCFLSLLYNPFLL